MGLGASYLLRDKYVASFRAKYQKEVTRETSQSFAKCADLEPFLRRMNEHEWAMLRYHMDRHATRKLHVPLGGSPLSMLMGSCCRRSR
jgi:hypothetical protein